MSRLANAVVLIPCGIVRGGRELGIVNFEFATGGTVFMTNVGQLSPFMEQQLINILMKLLARAGGGSLIKDMIQQVDTNRNPKVWTSEEIEKAIDYVDWQLSNFGTAEALAIIETLMKKYNLRPEDLSAEDNTLPEPSGVQGLQ